MKEGKASYTADVAVAFRAAESMKPENKRVCYDPLAKDFLSGIYGVIAGSPFLTKVAFWYAERLASTMIGTVVTRTRYIDDYLEACIDDRIEQAYGTEKAKAINLILCMNRIGNLSGISLDRFLHRISFGRWGEPRQEHSMI